MKLVDNENLVENHFRTLFSLCYQLFSKTDFSSRLRLCFSFLFLFLAKLIGVIVPFIFKLLVDTLNDPSKLVVLPLYLVVAYGIARALQIAFGELRDVIFIKVFQRVKRQIALKTFKKMHNLSLSYYLNQQKEGFSQIIGRGTKAIESVLSFMFLNIIPKIAEIFLVFILIQWLLDFRYAVMIFSTVLGYVLLTLSITEWRLKYQREMNLQRNHVNTKTSDSSFNYETVKYFNNEEYESNLFNLSLKVYEKLAVKSQLSLSLLNLAQALVVSLGTVSLLSLATYEVVINVLSIGDFVMLTSYMVQLFFPLSFLGVVYRKMRQGLIDVTEMMRIKDIKEIIEDVPKAQDLQITSGRIVFEKVHFSYDKDCQVIKDLSFEIEPRQTVAIVGPRSSGKSTIPRLLFRFYDPDSGRITIDGQDIKRVSQKSLRKAIGVVPQEAILFNNSIGYNIHYGQLNAREEKVIQAAKIAKLDVFIRSLKMGMKTIVGQRGVKLSRGEKQCISIARMILKNSPILIFDEATSALDSHIEKEIQVEIEQLSAKKSTLIIAHRLSTVINADRILVLKDGFITESGTHESLLEKKGFYASMWKYQQELDRVKKQSIDI